MRINSISNQSFGMDVYANETFWANINYLIWNNPKDKNSKKLFKQIEKIRNYPLKDTYEIQKVETPIKTEIKNNFFKNFNISVLDGYRLLDKTKNKTVLEQVANQSLKKRYISEITQTDFISYIVKNLRKISKMEKIK